MDLQDKRNAILAGGLITGLAPFVPFLNLGCCLYPIVGGIVAVAVYRSSSTRPLETSDGVTLGVMSGLAGAAIFAVLAVPITLMLGSLFGGFLTRLTPELGDAPAEVRRILEWVTGHFGAAIGVVLAVKVVAQLALSVVFGLLGGILGVAILKPRT